MKKYVFEGSEKKLEVVFSKNSQNLQSMPDSFFRSLLKKSRAQELNRFSNPYCTAFLLAESSLFVWDHRLVLITCGNTTLASALLYLSKIMGQKNILACFFQRKNEFFPLNQKTHFSKDVQYIRKKLKGPAYRFGPLDGHHFFLFHLDKEFSPEPQDQTVEILIYDMELKNLFAKPGLSPKDIRQALKLSECFPGFTMQDYVFKPAGYSLNALRGKEYYTIHITPQREGFYTSFETNINDENIIKKILILFKPLVFDVISFVPISSQRKNFVVDLKNVFRSAYCKKQACNFNIEFSSYQSMQNNPVQPCLIE